MLLQSASHSNSRTRFSDSYGRSFAHGTRKTSVTPSESTANNVPSGDSAMPEAWPGEASPRSRPILVLRTALRASMSKTVIRSATILSGPSPADFKGLSERESFSVPGSCCNSTATRVADILLREQLDPGSIYHGDAITPEYCQKVRGHELCLNETAFGFIFQLDRLAIGQDQHLVRRPRSADEITDAIR